MAERVQERGEDGLRRAQLPSAGKSNRSEEPNVGSETREQIIAAARMVFEREGYLEVGVEDIVTEAGVARGSFYTYFPTKLEVFKVLASRVGKQIREAVVIQPEDTTLDPSKPSIIRIGAISMSTARMPLSMG